ncbi:hypothetical protein HZC30_06590 [Candidatus Woesearchaeota archaeon]|nr:hypothetical protein [Candidatus Woesearchaeota archaeon]
MKRKPIWIPKECFTRPIEHLKGSPGYMGILLRGEITRFALNIGHSVFGAYNFDNVGDFLEHQKELIRNFSCVFPEVEVRGIARTEGKLELILGDETGCMYATYTWETRIHQSDDCNLDMAFDPWNNSIMGARNGDKLNIYDARYKGMPNHVALPFHYYVLNEHAYQRVSNMRKSTVEDMRKYLNQNKPRGIKP